VRVRHEACGLNFIDVYQRTGLYNNPLPLVPGMEGAGIVEAVGDRVTSWRVGDRVMGIESGACYAEYVVTHERQALPIPATVAMEDAAAIPEVFLTAWDALVLQGGLTSGRWALVHAGGSGVGTAAIQIARAIGARIVVTCSQRKMEACSALGADEVLERSPADWLSALQSTHRDGVDVVLDVVGGDEADRNLRAVRTRGTVVQVGLMGGGSTTVNLGVLLTKRVTWIGTTLRARPLEEKLAVCRQFAEEILPRFDDGSLRPVIHARFELADAADAHREMEADANVGKILLDIAS
jgi:putative PIG3 family NAD(P)H quinone oxidoreductase